MKRRTTLAAAAAWAASAAAQGPAAGTSAKGPWRIGWLSHHSEARGQLPIDTFKSQMRSRGLEFGRDYVLEIRYADNNGDRLPVGAAELVAMRPVLLVAPGSAAARALQLATRSIPIVGIGLTSPVEAGMVESFARPGGNLTGNTFNQPSFAGKTIEVLKLAAPKARRVAIVWNPDFTGIQLYKSHADRTAASLDVSLHYVDVRKPGDFRLQDLERVAPDALYVVYEYAVGPIVEDIIAFATAHRLPSIGTQRQFTASGGLLSLDPDPNELFAGAADYADRILHGANPATLPIREPTRYHLVVNRKAADAMRLVLPHPLLLQANEVLT